jgi:hypothetical protein
VGVVVPAIRFVHEPPFRIRQASEVGSKPKKGPPERRPERAHQRNRVSVEPSLAEVLGPLMADVAMLPQRPTCDSLPIRDKLRWSLLSPVLQLNSYQRPFDAGTMRTTQRR